jgi:Chaperone of endosialidase
MRKIALLCFIIAALAVASPAFAVLTTDNTNIGAHPSYGSGYSALWRSGFDYSVITDGTNTYLNAPSTGGSIIFRGNNTADPAITAPDGYGSRAYIDNGSNLQVAGQGVFWSGLTAKGYGLAGYSTNAGGTGVYGQAQTGLYGAGTNYGVYGSETTSGGVGVEGVAISSSGYAFYGIGPIFITSNTATKLNAGGWVGTSDIRTKKGVEPYAAGLSALLRVDPITYSFNGLGGTTDNSKRYVGVSAQALQEVLPSMVSSKRARLRPTDAEETDILQIDPSEFDYLLINSVKELDVEVKALREEVRRLKAPRR